MRYNVRDLWEHGQQVCHRDISVMLSAYKVPLQGGRLWIHIPAFCILCGSLVSYIVLGTNNSEANHDQELDGLCCSLEKGIC